MSEPIKIKRGDTFILALKVKVDAVPQDLTHWKIKSSVGNLDGRIADLKVDFMPQTGDTLGEFVLHGDTKAWPPGEATFDIRYTTDSEQIVTTETGKILITKSVTP